MTRPMKIRAVHLNNRPEPLTDCYCVSLDGFLIVAKDESDDSPIWYPLSSVDHMEGVEPQKSQSRQMRIAWM